jgi:hypothetical protein
LWERFVATQASCRALRSAGFSNLRVRATFELPTMAGRKARRTRSLERLRYAAMRLFHAEL